MSDYVEDEDKAAMQAVPYVNGAPLRKPTEEERTRQYRNSAHLMAPYSYAYGVGAGVAVALGRALAEVGTDQEAGR